MIETSIPESLFPKNARYIIDPGRFHVAVVGFHYDGLVGLPLPEPDLEARARLAHVGRETDVRRLHALLVDVNVQILQRANQSIN